MPPPSLRLPVSPSFSTSVPVDDQVLTVKANALTSDSGFARDQLPRAGSPVTDEKRQIDDSKPADLINAVVQLCDRSTQNDNCLNNIVNGNEGVVMFCHKLFVGTSDDDQNWFRLCVQNYCPNVGNSTVTCFEDFIASYILPS